MLTDPTPPVAPVTTMGPSSGLIPRIAMSKTRLRAVRAGARAAFGENASVPPGRAHRVPI